MIFLLGMYYAVLLGSLSNQEPISVPVPVCHLVPVPNEGRKMVCK
jgi:hypothetical protein